MRLPGAYLPGFLTRQLLLEVGGQPYRLRVLSDRQQFADPDDRAGRLGISSAQWSLFGQLWPSGRILAQAMLAFDIDGKRILELGCGIGLASLVLQRRGASIVASDMHPQAEPFLAYNAALNGLPAVHYRQLDWDELLPTLGTFDVIIASDVLYERGQAERLSRVVARHAMPCAEVLVTDPGRGSGGRFTREMRALGFSLTRISSPIDDEDPPPHHGELMHFRREGASA